jgi:hydroxymethylpyrimidine pyrophosphatase-like HAD family hydrolase
MDLGIYRQVCSNGAIAFDQHGESTQIKHTEINARDLFKFIQSVNNKTDKVLESFGILQNKNMTVEEAREFAHKAAKLRYSEDQISDITINDLLSVNRIEDESNDLWTVFNRVQENLTANITNPNQDIRLNKQLFNLADQYVLAV